MRLLAQRIPRVLSLRVSAREPAKPIDFPPQLCMLHLNIVDRTQADSINATIVAISQLAALEELAFSFRFGSLSTHGKADVSFAPLVTMSQLRRLDASCFQLRSNEQLHCLRLMSHLNELLLPVGSGSALELRLVIACVSSASPTLSAAESDARRRSATCWRHYRHCAHRAGELHLRAR